MPSVVAQIHVEAAEVAALAKEAAELHSSLERLSQRVCDELQPLLSGDVGSLSLTHDSPALKAGKSVAAIRVSCRKLELVAAALRALNLDFSHKILDTSNPFLES